MRLRFLFWNTNRRNLADVVTELASDLEIDLLILAESTNNRSELLQSLNPHGSSNFHLSDSRCDKIQIYTGFSRSFVRPCIDSARFSIRHVEMPDTLDFLLVGLHLPSQLHWTTTSLGYECAEVVQAIQRVESEVGHRRTIVVGDFNQDPFASGVVSSVGFNAVMASHLARKKSRVVNGVEYPYFYNPMWSYMGDRSPGPPGTYFYDSSQHHNTFWRTFDQVLLRPELLDHFAHESIQVVTHSSSHALARENGTPDSKKYSDHFPLVFSLDL